ncbi:Zn(2)-C6 fungal-type domain-containing protein [Mycena indigotica]|uniref:Zn(2)-C6 fungal-type domain-containing protein n=1 Tax=Mycena indigotica TaxID=2126181 RepID=A0A8H6WG95_9AGAR|nr:Zn(2)-C6 fungal-type domain-containing protein [Mycena indigotica]KAF7315601.1 Zn(2)-C6 fungal-type domain-containing protein [Mycena indigotica]
MASAGLGVPVKLLHESLGHIITVELKTGAMYRGKLAEAEDNLNISLKDITVTGRDGRVSQLDQVYIRGSMVRFFIVPDMLQNAPMQVIECVLHSLFFLTLDGRFKRVGPNAMRGRGIGTARGRATIMRGQSQTCLPFTLDIDISGSSKWCVSDLNRLSLLSTDVICSPSWPRVRPNPIARYKTVKEGESNRAVRQVRAVNRACDACRRRKTRCDGPKQVNSVCSSCRVLGKSCTYLEASTPRGPPKAYVTALEDRLEQLEELLHHVRPDADFSSELGPPIVRGSWKDDIGGSSSSSAGKASARSRRPSSPPRTSIRFTSHLALNSHWRQDNSDSDDSDELNSSDSENMADVIKGDLRKLTATYDQGKRSSGDDPLDTITTRFHGKSSLISLIDMTRRYRELFIEEENKQQDEQKPKTLKDHYTPTRRNEFWEPLPWEVEWERSTTDVHQIGSLVKEFPPDSLASDLINIYFASVNPQLPLLHRPTFERQFQEKLHHRHHWFACVCLSLFAVASRWSNDPLVLPRNCRRTTSGGFDWSEAGRHYYSLAMEIHRSKRTLLYPACLEEVQTFSLIAFYLRGSASHPSAAWIFVSIGLRKALDVGAHRQKIYSDTPSVEEELWKRAVWCLIAYDRFGSAILGRPCALDEEDFDLDMCLEVDDEFWEADPPFKQPSEIPCRITYFNLWLRLAQIVTFTVKTIYAIPNPAALLGRIAKVRTEEVTAQLTQSLQDWLHSVPDYLRWSPQIEDEVFANQSACLIATYYLAEILIWRAFIPPVPTPTMPNPPAHHINSSVPALSYCVTSARSITQIAEVQCARGWRHVPILIAVGQLAVGILTLAVWDAKSQGHTGNHRRIFEDVKPPPAQTVRLLMDDINTLIRSLEVVGGHWEEVTSLINTLKDALPKEAFDHH